MRRRRQSTATTCLSSSVTLRPGILTGHVSVSSHSDPLPAAQALLRQGKLQEAKGLLDAIPLSAPAGSEARFILGMIACQSQAWEDAVERLDAVVRRQPNRFEAVYGLGLARSRLGEHDAALPLLKHAVGMAPGNPVALNELGLCLLKLKDPTAALAALEHAARLAPGAGQVQHNLGLAFVNLDRLDEARASFERAIQLAPQEVESHVQLAMIFERLGDWEACHQYVRAGLKHCAEDATLLGMLARSNSELGMREEAEQAYRSASDRYPAVGARYALWLQEEGRFDESISVLWDSIQRLPVQGAAYYGLTEAKSFDREGEPWIDAALRALEGPDLDVKERVYLLFAIARLYEAQREFETAFIYFDRANDAAYRCFNEARPYDRDQVRALNDRRMQRFRSAAAATGIDGPAPIFIVGMIRSGTTLLDQILSSHPDAGSAGELMFWTIEADRHLAAGAPALVESERSRLAAAYRQLLRSKAGDQPRSIDKMPLNYAHLGLIHEVCPGAKILHIRRDPLDTCVSIYTNHFGLGPIFAYSKANIAFNYREYLRLMDHWRQTIPPTTLYELDYEDLVSGSEGKIKDVLAFLGLPWNDACLRHTANRGAVRTPSRWQARQEIYNTSIGRWRHYEPWLGELRNAGRG